MPKIDKEVRKCVAFVASKTIDGKFQLRGSVFFTGLEKNPDDPGQILYPFWVTAKHVIDGIKRLGTHSVYVRFNTKAGATEWVETNISEWHVDPNDPSRDVAIRSGGWPNWADHHGFGTDLRMSSETQERLNIDVTDDVCVVGLFRHRAGESRNIPIVRVGTIASMDRDDHVETPLGAMPAYLIEARSIGGLSGSPVFVLPGMFRPNMTKEDSHVLFLGLIHGHYDSDVTDIDYVETDIGLSKEKVNTGIAIVTPEYRMYEFAERLRSEDKLYRDGVPPEKFLSFGDATKKLLSHSGLTGNGLSIDVSDS